MFRIDLQKIGCLMASCFTALTINAVAQAQDLSTTGVQPVAAEPNIVIIYADDLGYGDVRCYNPSRGKIPTPNIDRLASQGMKFTDGHSSSGVCSPSRYTLLTGRYHWRTSLQKGIVGLWNPPLIAKDRLTIAGMLGRQGYDTACIGKWHLGWDWAIRPGDLKLFRGDKRNDIPATPEQQAAWKHTFSQPIGGGPIARGFDEYFGVDVPNWPPYCFIDQDRTIGIPAEFLPKNQFLNNMASVQGPAIADWKLEPTLPALADRAAEYIARKSKQANPFFIYMPLTSPHTPLAVNDEWRGKSGLNAYADLVMETDAIVGRVLESIASNGIEDSTLVIFTSDNGCAPYIGIDDLQSKGHYPSGPLRGAKSDVWEGGHRVPFIVRWPGNVRAGSQCDQLVHQADLMATCAAVAGAELPDTAGEDSYSLLPLLAGGDQPVREHAVSQSMKGIIGVRQGAWKLIFGKGSGGWGTGADAQSAQLYDLANDLGETTNLYSRHPDKAAELTDLMEKIVDEGRSTPGAIQENDKPFDWKKFMPAKTK